MQSGAFALTQLSLADAEEFGQNFAESADCPDQSAECLRGLPVSALVDHFPPAAIPGVVPLTEPSTQFGKQLPRYRALMELLDHFPWTLGQTVVYLRENGVKPPTYTV